jgi:Rieske Fe-S protein
VAVPFLTRRAVVRGSLVTVVGGVTGYLTARTSGAARGGRGTTAANAYGPATGPGGEPLIALDQLPPGHAVVLAGERVVLARSSDGTVHAFSAVCTHQGCTVGVAGGSLACPCHGSMFNPGTGAVLQGPADRPLPSVRVTVRNGKVYRS